MKLMGGANLISGSNDKCPVTFDDQVDSMNDPEWTGNKILREADWILNESPNLGLLAWLSVNKGLDAKILQNICGWKGQDSNMWKEVDFKKYGLYGYAGVNLLTTLPDELFLFEFLEDARYGKE